MTSTVSILSSAVSVSGQIPGSLVGLDLRLYPEPEANLCNHTPGGGGSGTLRFYGRIVSRRPMALGEEVDPPIIEGVDTIRVEVWDRNTGDDRLLWSGLTGPNGCFDSGVMVKLGEQDPDIYLRVVADTPNVRMDEYEIGTYAWDTDEDELALFFPDFAGDELHFGAARPAIPILPDYAWALLQIHNTITRAERWMRVSSGLNIDLPKMIVREPQHTVSFYDILTGRIVHAGMGLEGLANERVYLHHYAHFLQDQYGSVQADDCTDQSGCTRDSPWCEAVSPTKAWQEGFADWFADMMIERLKELYAIDGGAPWPPAGRAAAPFEHVAVCPATGVFPDSSDLDLASGMFTAFLVDMTDGHLDPQWYLAQDDEKALTADNYSDCSRTGWFEILSVTTQSSLPLTPAQFVANYASAYPQQRPALYWTAYNITPEYLASTLFPDAQAPGAVPAAGSRQVGSSPCIPLTVDPPPDDGTGACAYSWEWVQNPAGAPPDFTADVLGSCTLPGPVLAPGDWYVSIRARDCANNWSSQYATFGPFEIRDCNGNGIVDACETSCDESSLRAAFDCDIPLDLCDSAPCTPNDCNGNLTPDDCDIAGGFSQDCNQDSIPDDCQQDSVQQWIGGDGAWQVPENWSPLANGQLHVPGAETHVCIGGPQDRVTITNDAARSKSLRSAGEIVVGGPSGTTVLEMNQSSFIDNVLRIESQSSTVNAGDLEVETVRMPSGGRLRGRVKIRELLEIGATSVTFGRALLTDPAFVNGEFIIGDGATATAGAAIFFEAGNERLHVEPNGAFTFHGDGTITAGFGLLEIDGAFTRASGTGEATVFSNTINRGRIDVLEGDLTFFRSLDNSGIIAGQSGTTIKLGEGTTFAGTSELEAGTLGFGTGSSSAPIVIRGKLDLKDGITVQGLANVTVDASANVISYGDSLQVRGLLALQPVIGAEIVFDDITLTQGQITFESGDPVRTKTLTVGALMRDLSQMTVTQTLAWNASAHFIDSVLITEGSTLFGPGTSTRSLKGSEWVNRGTVTVDQYVEVDGNSKLVNALGATIDLANSSGDVTLIGGGTSPIVESYLIENDGLIIKSTPATDPHVYPGIWNRGELIADAGPIVLHGYLRQTAGQTLVKGGNISLYNASHVFRLQGGLFGGTQAFVGHVENTGGSVQPAEALTGLLTIDGNYTQTGAGELHVQITGPDPGMSYDQLIVTGAADIQAGRLKVDLLNNYQPAAGQQFTILAAAGVQGTFTELATEGVFQVSVGPDAIVLTYQQSFAQLTDGDHDGDVDDDDVALFEACVSGPAVPLAPGCEHMDFDGDGDVDQTDFATMQLCYSGADNPANPHCGN